MTLVNLSFSSIYLLYNEVLKVIGVNAPIVGSEQKAIEQIQGKTEQSAEGSNFLSGCPALGGDMGSLVGALQGTYCSCSDGCFIAPFIARIMLGGMPCYFGCCLPVPLVTILGGGFLLGFILWLFKCGVKLR